MDIENQKKHAPATERNRDPILEVLKDVLPSEGTVLEIASGSGEHAMYFTEHLAPLFWQPSDPDKQNRDSIRAWWWDVQFHNILPAVNINTCDDEWAVEVAPPPQPISAMVCINMIHIAPWEAAVGLFEGANRILPSGSPLFLYGPYMIDGKHTSDSNAEFDQWLKDQHPAWGVRDLEEIKRLADQNNMAFDQSIAMPANNFSIIFRKK